MESVSNGPFKYPTSCADSQFSQRNGEPRLRCDYCGSLTVEDVLTLLKTPGTKFSGSDWKYGYPHKFYLFEGSHQAKFYTKHLTQATDEQLIEFDSLSRKTWGIAWKRGEHGAAYLAPSTTCLYGWQLDGSIGPNGVPQHSEFCIQDAERAAAFFVKLDEKARSVSGEV